MHKEMLDRKLSYIPPKPLFWWMFPRRSSSMPFTPQVPPARMDSCARRLVVPAQICVVAQLARLDEMRDGEEGAENDADATDDDVGDAEERVLATHYSASGDYDGLCATIFGYVEIYSEG
jgi:hypothetical protein